MKPEMSTAVMIERLRALASESQDSVLLSSVASRIELLLAAESGMSREMACIRHALDIPPDQSVQSGVVDAFVRLNAKIQDLSGQLSELGRQSGIVAWVHKGQPWQIILDRDIEEVRKTSGCWLPLGVVTIPQAVSHPSETLYKIANHIAGAKGGMPDEWQDWVDEVETDIRRAAMLQIHIPDAGQMVPAGYALVPTKATAAMVSAAGRAAREYMEEYGGNNPQVIYQAMLNAAPQPARKDGDA
ncbi:hypothetical protein AB6D49_07075 [Pectobacterium brasiliense]|uniref:hypothetical protein n=1 Tax=Pectobacterium brasiliense TaxID=180957 RepID=UPI003987879A